jgi:hypothetical protein
MDAARRVVETDERHIVLVEGGEEVNVAGQPAEPQPL